MGGRWKAACRPGIGPIMHRRRTCSAAPLGLRAWVQRSGEMRSPLVHGGTMRCGKPPGHRPDHAPAADMFRRSAGEESFARFVGFCLGKAADMLRRSAGVLRAWAQGVRERAAVLRRRPLPFRRKPNNSGKLVFRWPAARCSGNERKGSRSGLDLSLFSYRFTVSPIHRFTAHSAPAFQHQQQAESAEQGGAGLGDDGVVQIDVVAILMEAEGVASEV